MTMTTLTMKLLVTGLGGVIYLAAGGKVSEVGKMGFFVGLLSILLPLH